LIYSLNRGGWLPYPPPVAVASGAIVQAQNVAGNPSVASGAVTTQAYYQLVSEFDGSAAGAWTSPVGGSNLVDTITPGNPTTTFSHGNTTLDLGNGQSIDAGIPNTLAYTENNFSGVLPNVPFTLGTLVLVNGTTFNNSEASGVTLKVTLALTNPPLDHGEHPAHADQHTQHQRPPGQRRHRAAGQSGTRLLRHRRCHLHAQSKLGEPRPGCGRRARQPVSGFRRCIRHRPTPGDSHKQPLNPRFFTSDGRHS
jgi:hypothetical protein